MFLAKMIESKLSDGFTICEVNGEQTPVEYTPSIHDEYFTPPQRDCYPVTTRSKSKPQENPNATDSQETKITGENEVVFGYNSQAKPLSLMDPKLTRHH